MTDRELLEQAAKAAGIGWHAWFPDKVDGASLCLDPNGRIWNPLTDDGDALRLAVALDMNLFQAAKSAYALPSDDDGTYEEQVRYIDAANDKFAATRRAIVRAAAAIAPSE